METKELRLNNWVNCDLNESPIIVRYISDNDTISTDEIRRFNKNGVQSIKGFSPIPLTDEWKTKLSFKQFPYEPENLNEGYYWSLQVIKGIYLTIEDGDDYAYLDYGLDFNGTKNLIKYDSVHEIQNVYHSLKKEDITIK